MINAHGLRKCRLRLILIQAEVRNKTYTRHEIVVINDNY